MPESLISLPWVRATRGKPCETRKAATRAASRRGRQLRGPPAGGPQKTAKLRMRASLADHAALARSVLAFFSARTGQRLHREEDRQHFFLTFPAFISLRTRAFGSVPVLLTSPTLGEANLSDDV